jgi:hypothetical protein
MMRRNENRRHAVTILARAAIALTAVAVAAPASAQAVNDVRCLLVSNLFAKAGKDQKQRTTAEAAGYYYLGRIHGRMKPAQLKAQMVAQSKAVTAANSGATMSACARQLQASLKTAQAVLGQAGRRP